MLYGLGLIGICLAWLLPGHYYPYTAFQQDSLSAAGATVIALAAVVTTRDWPVRLPSPATAALLLTLVPAAQWAFGMLPFASDALLSIIYLCGFALAIVVGRLLAVEHPRFVCALFAAVAIGALASSAIGFVQWMGLGPYPFIEVALPGGRMVANLSQPNQLASLLGMGIASALWSFETRRMHGTAVAVIIAVLGAGLVLTQSRTGWLLSGAFVALWAIYRQRLQLRVSLLPVASAVVLFALAVVLRVPFESWLNSANPSGAVGNVRGLTAGMRTIHWQTLLDALTQSPWLGYGWLQIAAAQQAAVLDHPPTFELLSAAHNQFLDFLIWNGVPLGLVIIGFITWWAVDRARRCANLDTWAAMLMLTVLVAHSMVELPLQYAYFLLPAGLLVGVIEARTPVPRFGLLVARMPFVVMLVALSSLLYALWVEYDDIDESLRQVRLKYEARVIPSGVAPLRPPDVLLLDGQREYVNLWLNEPRTGMPASELDWLRTVSRRYPSPGAQMRYALAAGLNGRDADARRSLELLCRISAQARCDASRSTWAAHVVAMPQLNSITFPPTPVLP